MFVRKIQHWHPLGCNSNENLPRTGVFKLFDRMLVDEKKLEFLYLPFIKMNEKLTPWHHQFSIICKRNFSFTEIFFQSYSLQHWFREWNLFCFGCIWCLINFFWLIKNYIDKFLLNIFWPSSTHYLNIDDSVIFLQRFISFEYVTNYTYRCDIVTMTQITRA